MPARWPMARDSSSRIRSAAARPAHAAGRPCWRAMASIACSTTSTRCIADSNRDTIQSPAMTVRRSLACVSLIAALNGCFFIWYQQPDWQTQWTDQDGYRRLAQVLSTTGKFTRFPDAPTFVPEVLRTPLYPLFVAVLYRVSGAHQLPIALAQTIAFA